MRKNPQKKKANWGFSNLSLRGRSDLIMRLLHFVLNDINDVFIFAFLFLLPTQLGKHFFLSFSYLSGVRVDYLAPTIFLTDILAIALIALNIKSVVKLLLNKWVAVFLLLLTIGGFLAQAPEVFLYRFLKVIELLGIFAVFRYRKVTLRSMFIAFFIGAAFEVGLVVLQFLNKQSLQGIFYLFGERYLNLSMPGVAKASLQGVEFLRPYGTFSHPNSMAGFYLLLYVFFSRQKLHVLFLKNIFLVLIFLIILFSFSKTALVAFFIIQVLYLRDEFKGKVCWPCVVSKIILFAIPLVIFAVAKTDPLSFEKRYLLFQNSLILIGRHPLLGVGLGNYLVAQESLPASLVSFPYQPVHNIFLLFAAEAGLLSLFYLGYFGIKKFLGEWRNEIFVACCTVLVLTGLLDHYWLSLQQNFLLMGVIWGALAAASYKPA